MSTSIAASQPIFADKVMAQRPASQTSTRTARGDPWSGNRPVQFGIAVSRKPVMMAGTKPNSSSWTCQSRGEKAVASDSSP